MEHATKEMAQLEIAVNEAADVQLLELNELHLAFVGGGCATVVLE